MPLRVCIQKPRINFAMVFALVVFGLASALSGFAQGQPLGDKPFKNYFVTGDYTVAGWVEQSSANGLATGIISVPDCIQAAAMGMPCPPAPVPAGADIVAAYLYWGTVEGSQSLFVGQQAFFNGYKIIGDVLGNPNAPTSWSAGGCSGSSAGSKTMRIYRADVRPYLPLDLNSASPTFGALQANGPVSAQITDSGSNGNTQPNALGATLVLVYRVLSPALPLKAIVFYDGSYAPSNQLPTMTQSLIGFYEPDESHSAKLTQIVANGQANKGQNVFFGANQLVSLYAGKPPFPGVYNVWDNPTWDVTQYVTGGPVGSGFDTQETVSVSPSSTNSGCVNWGAMVFSTTVRAHDGDGLLDIWKSDQHYIDAVSGNTIELPNAQQGQKDLFVEVDYLTLRDAGNNVVHSHLPKQAALDAVGQAFANSPEHINVHFDLPGTYLNDPYVVSTTGQSHSEISENSLLCTDPANPGPGQLCPFPGQAAVSWKGGFSFVQNDSTLGAFQPGRGQSYRYALFGHAIGEPRSYWATVGTTLVANNQQNLASLMPQLVSIQVSANNTGTVTIKSPSKITQPDGTLVDPLTQPLMLKPGDCGKFPANPACADANTDRVTISGAHLVPAAIFAPGKNLIDQQPSPLNGTYAINKNSVSSSAADANGMITTTFQITTAGVPAGIYNFSNEPQLGVSFMGSTSSSGHGDFGGGGDLAVTFGLWRADDKDPNTGLPNCQPDPSQPFGVGQTKYCDDQVGTLKAQTGTLMHELGHTLTLSHGGAYYNIANAQSVATYDLNCKPNFVSVMNYLFQIRGFVDGGFDYSGQTLPALNETTATVGNIAGLSESAGLGYDANSDASAHLTRWYSKPNNPGDAALQAWSLAHCDGTPLAVTEDPNTIAAARWVRVDGQVAPGGDFSAPLDWNNDFVVPNAVADPGEDLNHNGTVSDPPFAGFNDWAVVDLQQVNGRSSGFGFSEGGGIQFKPGGGIQFKPGGGIDGEGGGIQFKPGGGIQFKPGGGIQFKPGGGLEQDTDVANSTVDAPTGLNCLKPLPIPGGTVPACTGSVAPFSESSKSVPLSWTSPDFGQIRTYTIWRALGSFPTREQVLQNISSFSAIKTLSGAPPVTSFVDSGNLKPTKTYTYFVSDSNKPGAKSSASAPVVVIMK